MTRAAMRPAKGVGMKRPQPPPRNPALLRHAEERRRSLENRVADHITRFAGSPHSS
jgi:hypothetical protein